MPRSILLIDDDISVIHTLRNFFERSGWEVAWATSGEEGVRVFDACRTDLILLDYHLPGLTGLHVLELLVARAATVIMLTGHGDIECAVEAMRLGAENFLTKPVALPHLAAAAERAGEKAELRRAKEALAAELADERRLGGLGRSGKMRDLAQQLELLAASNGTTILLLGESGTGKGWVAQRIHAQSARARGPFVEINCAGLSATFLDSELFGHEKGAFTDARSMKQGLFEIAHGGTLFLDEIGDLAPELQPKLLKVLEQRRFRRLGGTREIEVDVRVVAATNKSLQEEVRTGAFREDLYYRLNVLPLTLPPLRERTVDDVLELVHRLLLDLRAQHPRAPQRIADRTLPALAGYDWPGNVRELRNVLERAIVLAAGAGEIGPEHLPPHLRSGRRPARGSTPGLRIATLQDVERLHIESALLLLRGNRTHVADALGISRATLHTKIKLYRLETVGCTDSSCQAA